MIHFCNIYYKFLFSRTSLLILITSFLTSTYAKGPLAEISTGKLQGAFMKTPYDNTFEAFLGIPYAQPPVGDLRFKESQPKTSWNGTYDADKYGNICLQYTHFGYEIIGSEDCLFVNVFKPINNPNINKIKYDVLVFIHGGAFMFASSNMFNISSFMEDSDIIVVTFNYRLGPLGFLSTGDKTLPGNLGLKDQVLALKWIKKNIEFFDGDPNKITLYGHSAGGASVHFHMLSSMSKGLFNQAIASSGVALNPWAVTENIVEKSKTIARDLGCDNVNSTMMVDCLTRIPAKSILERVPQFFKWLYIPYTPFGPTIEPEDAENPFLNRHPYEIIKDGNVSNVPWMISLVTEEGLYPTSEFIANAKLMQHLETSWLDYAPHLLDFNNTVAPRNKDNITKTITKYYLKDKHVANSVSEIIKMVSDRLFTAGIAQAAIMQTAVSKAPVYMYVFSYRGNCSLSDMLSHNDTNYGVSHGDDIAYIFGLDLIPTNKTKADRKMQSSMKNFYKTFIKTGVPEFIKNSPLPSMNKSWPQLKFIDIESPTLVKIKTEDELGEMKFWSTLDLQEKLKLPEYNKCSEYD